MNSNLILIFIFHCFVLNGQYKSSIYSKWVISPDVPIIIDVFNSQSNFYDQKVSIEYDKSFSFGIDLLKYFPNKNIMYSIIPRYYHRVAVLNTNPSIFFGDNTYQLNGLINFLKSKNDTFIFENIIRYTAGFGLSASYSSPVYFDRYRGNAVVNNPEIINKFKIEGLISLGIIQDVFNINNRRTSLSKLNLILRFPFFNQSANFTNKYLNLEPDIVQFQKAKSTKVVVEIRYNHLIDFKRNTRSNDFKSYDEKWNEIDNPIKNYFPPIINNDVPKKDFYGNFFFEYNLFNNMDSIEFPNTNRVVDITNKLFTNYSFGYTLNLFGNYKKYISKKLGQEIISENNWRYNCFLSTGLKITNIIGSRFDSNINVYLNELLLKAGFKYNKSNNKWNFAVGAAYFKEIYSISYINNDKSNLPKLKNSSFFVAVGSSNIYFKFESKFNHFQIFNLKSVLQELSCSISFGL